MKKPRKTPTFIIILGLLVSANTGLSEEDFQTQTNEPSAFVPGSWTVVVLPDTQYYVAEIRGNKEKGFKTVSKEARAERHNMLNGMADWIVSEKDKRNIRMVVHVGDMTEKNLESEWELIRSSYRKLDDVVPYLLCVGNHDERLPEEKSRINDYFNIGDNSLNQSIFQGTYTPGELQNTYYILKQNSVEYLFLALEYNTREAVVEWADKVIKEHSGHHVFITVHNYMDEASRLISKDGRPDPEMHISGDGDFAGIYRKLVMANPNVEFLACGHVCAAEKGSRDWWFPKGYQGRLFYTNEIATGHRSDLKTSGLTAHQILFNAQWINSGDGWMLLMEFLPDNKTVKVKTYSSHRKLWRTGPEYEYTLKRN